MAEIGLGSAPGSGLERKRNQCLFLVKYEDFETA